MSSEYQTQLLKDYDDNNSHTTINSLSSPTLKGFELENGTYQHPQPKLSLLSKTTSTLKTLLLLTSFLLLLTILKETHTTTQALQSHPLPSKNYSCGHSPAEARSNNCHFDVMLTTWLHADCFYPDLMNSYLALHNFTWARDTSLTDVVSLDEIRMGEHKHIYVTREFHYVHCAYTWDMQLLAFHNSSPLLESLADPEHGRHCSKLLIDHVLPRNETSLTVVGELCSLPVRQAMALLEGFRY